MRIRRTTVIVAASALMMLPTGAALAHGQSSNGCDGLNNAGSRTHDRDPHGHDEVHEQQDAHHCD